MDCRMSERRGIPCILYFFAAWDLSLLRLSVSPVSYAFMSAVTICEIASV